MKPDATKHDPRPEYLRALIARAGLTHRAAAEAVGKSERMMCYYTSSGKDHRPAPKAVVLVLQQIAGELPDAPRTDHP